MSRIALVRSVVLLLLVLFVAAPFASAAAPPDRTVRSAISRFEAPALLFRLMSWLTGGVWEKNGCMIDPDGRCLSGTGAAPAPPAGPDNGCGIDPGGRCGG